MSPESPIPTPPHRRRGIYLLPNLFTTAALFAGFYAIIAAIKGHFEAAAIAIFIAMVLDGLDGRVARMTNTQSHFGAEYDSLSDLVSFGLAPALVMYEWSLSSLGKLGWLAAFVYTAATALRLARFNVYVGKIDKAYFQGLASPASAAVMAGLVWVATDYQIAGETLSYLALVITLLMSFLMVSNIRFRSFKDIDRDKVPFMNILLVVVVIVLIAISPSQMLFGTFLIYALSGVVMFVLQWFRGKRGVVDTTPKPPI
ncbi:CDP-diacylglycerol--serine O-phosphatidyltransferase [Beggiatoa leptomitoformis]|uniref:CDP-diacylglycerol--serine O-phosphatidyltransferase n=1 Tax=Beggiatoa leptomitoformis TaxID=288004 RepID=A0A2N9YEG2_9GAMM|nr:CDP-diacylglycerol--serine O-phosphatidyltransferase [Beggiatoa leptomitoformis]ALG68751.1 CDP-diacylglycerol--serine O-phosphatidyltransferase [Beggiatoa leptomitoformis]AUI68888.1 CDP-diacylglycerol--serine O-phosphatidyltransferase [Beggiatoa leptomitoformis]